MFAAALRRRPASALTALCLSATVVSASYALAGCTQQPASDSDTEQAVALAMDAPRITLTSTGEGEARLLTFHDISEAADAPLTSSSTFIVGESFSQHTTQSKDATTPPAPTEDATATEYSPLTLPLTGSTLAAAEAGEGEADADRDVEVILGVPEGGVVDGDAAEQAEDLATVEGFTLGWRAENSGQISTVRFAAPTEASDSARETVERGLMKLISLPVVFPDEEVAPGAVWQVESRVSGDSALLQTTTCTLVSVSGDEVELDVSVAQRPTLTAVDFSEQLDAAREQAEQQGAATASENSLPTSVDVIGSGTTMSAGHLTVNLTQPLPTSGELIYTTRVLYGTADGGDQQTYVAQDTTTALRFE